MTLSITQIVLICFGFFMLGGTCGVGVMCLMFASRQGDDKVAWMIAQQKENAVVAKALALYRAMVLGGEKESEQTKRIYDAAMDKL